MHKAPFNRSVRHHVVVFAASNLAISLGEGSMNENWVTIPGVVVRGHQVASKTSEHYPHGTIEMQIPFFKALHLDLSSFYSATLNISISPHTFTMKAPKHTFRRVRWTASHPPEDFSFSACWISYQGIRYDGWVYYPHPETKERHYQDQSVIELITRRIADITYGDNVEVAVNSDEILVDRR